MSDTCTHEFCPCDICSSESAIRENLVQCYHCPKMKEWGSDSKEDLEKKLKEIHKIIESILSDPIKNYIGYVGSLKKIEELSKC